MANILANSNGDWHTGATWVGGVVPGVNDTAYLNNKALTAAANITCKVISSRAENGAVTGGSITYANGITITTEAIRQGNTAMITMASNTTLNVVGELEGSTGPTTNVRLITTSVNCVLNVTGRTLAGTVTGSNAIYSAAAGAVVTIVGDGEGSNTAAASAVVNAGTGTIYITGTVKGGANANAFAVTNSGAGAVTIVGNSIGGNSGSAYGCQNSGSGTITVHGIGEGGVGGASGVNNSSNGIIYLKRAKGNGYGTDSGAPISAGAVGASNTGQNGAIYIEQLEFGPLGQSPVSGTGINLTDSLDNVCIMRRVGTTAKILVDPLNVDGLVPDPSNVRAGVVYGYGNLFGYCIVPAPESVAFGVPVGDGYGTAILTGANVWNVLLSEIITPGSIGQRMKNCSTIASTGQQLADALSG